LGVTIGTLFSTVEHKVPGQHITNRQEELYMQHRQDSVSQEVAAAKAGVSVRSGRRIEKPGAPRNQAERDWRAREDPLAALWNAELVVLLEREPSLTGTTLLEYLEEPYPGHYDQKILRTLQRRIKQWKALNGPERDVIFRQQAVVTQQGFSDFTHPDSAITIQGVLFKHRLYQFRLAYSGWRSVTLAQGGESYAALACGLQRALQQARGSPIEHRTDSLSAARNNLGQSHENGVVECANGSLKRRLSQQLKLRGHHDFESVEAYQAYLDKVVEKLNRRSHTRFTEERQTLQPLPVFQAADYQTLNLNVTRSSTIEVRRVLYTVPSHLIGERVQVRLYHDKLILRVGQHEALTLRRVYPKPSESRARSVNYKHVIRSLAAKPQAFRYSQLRDNLLPDDNYHQLWQLADQHLEARNACKWIVTVLRLAYEHDDEQALGYDLLASAKAGKFASITELQAQYLTSSQSALHSTSPQA
jgi:hypothetical protein